MKKIVWLAISCIMVVSLAMASCGGDEDADGTTTPGGPTSDEPQYGGTIIIRDGVEPNCCDSFANKMMTGGPVILYVYEQLLAFDKIDLCSKFQLHRGGKSMKYRYIKALHRR